MADKNNGKGNIKFHGYMVPERDARKWYNQMKKGRMSMEDLHAIMEKRKTNPNANLFFMMVTPRQQQEEEKKSIESSNVNVDNLEAEFIGSLAVLKMGAESDFLSKEQIGFVMNLFGKIYNIEMNTKNVEAICNSPKMETYSEKIEIAISEEFVFDEEELYVDNFVEPKSIYLESALVGGLSTLKICKNSGYLTETQIVVIMDILEKTHNIKITPKFIDFFCNSPKYLQHANKLLQAYKQ